MNVAIIGAGSGGIGLAIALRRAGYDDLTIFERSGGVGGTWRANTYPGAACDIPSHLYSFSFEPYAGWSRAYASQAEILAYLALCVDKYDLRRHLRLNAEVAAARFDETSARWEVRLASGESHAYTILVSACGQLNRPAYPHVAGRETFAGPQFHSARWRHDVALAGKRVAVIGTGASAIQFVPEIARQVRQLDLYQRTPPYVIPRADVPYPRWLRGAFAVFPGLQRLSRTLQYVTHEARALGFTRLTWAMEMPRRGALRHMRRMVGNAELRAKLVPDYPIGCKRILVSNDYYPALARDNVTLVTEEIARITPRGVVTTGGLERPAAVLIYGTGFHATEFLVPMKVTGANGVDLHERWRDGAQAYLGISVTGFPNFFLLYGPNTNLGHNSIVYMLESQIRYVMSCIDALAHGARSLDVRADVQSAFNARLQRRMRQTIWSQGCSSWYQTAGGKHTNNWPSFTFAYRRATRRIALEDYDVAPTAREATR